ncbi:RNA polymerase sigma factor [Paucibacter sp. JuS9]|uniref:RNA polymerase sigma factor n=1 Tax=Paucibacter sp. JuS9 TaxID=3228748 RepID=UPI003756A0BA
MSASSSPQDQLYREALQSHGAELARFVGGYERDPARRQELQQDLQLAIWQSLAGFRGDCSLRTWVYRVAHNVGARHVQQHAGRAQQMLALEEAEQLPDERQDPGQTERRLDLQRILALVHRLKPLDRELMLLYLEDLDAAGMAEITGLSARNVATKIHRIKAVLATQLGLKRNAP